MNAIMLCILPNEIWINSQNYSYNTAMFEFYTIVVHIGVNLKAMNFHISTWIYSKHYQTLCDSLYCSNAWVLEPCLDMRWYYYSNSSVGSSLIFEKFFDLRFLNKIIYTPRFFPQTFEFNSTPWTDGSLHLITYHF